MYQVEYIQNHIQTYSSTILTIDKTLSCHYKDYMGIQKIRQAWEDHGEYMSQQTTQLDLEKVNSRLASIFCPGPFYHYIFDFQTYSFDRMSDDYNQLSGLDPETATIDQFLERIHPDDVAFFSKAENTAAHFLFGYLEPNQIFDYKVSYCFRQRDASGQYKLILHQAMALTLDSEDRLGKVLGVHSDISHITNINTYKISFFGLNGHPSFTNIDVFEDQRDHIHLESKVSEISIREVQVLRLISEGMKAKEIGGLLHISEATVRKHRENLLRKTNSANSPQLIAYSIRNGLI